MSTYRIPAYRVKLIRDGSVPFESRPQVSSSDGVLQIARKFFEDAAYELLVVLFLDAKSRIIGSETQEGSIDRAVIYPRKVVTAALLHNASSIIMMHNHPSGDANPSPDDKRLTRSVVEACRTVDIRVVDHMIVGDGTESYFSFVEHSLL